MDEFGKGTAGIDGCALLAAVISDLAGRGAACPRVLATTHLTEVLEMGLLEPVRAGLRLLVMDVLTSAGPPGSGGVSGSNRGGGGGGGGGGDEGALDPDGEPPREPPSVTFLYTVREHSLQRGLTASYGGHCARIAGVPEKVVRRAAQVTRALAKGRPVPPTAEHRGKAAAARAADGDAAGDLASSRAAGDEAVLAKLLEADVPSIDSVTAWLAELR
jgi:DNA mismatch repair protein MSH5